MKAVVFTFRARADLVAIAERSEADWGVAQRLRYTAVVHGRIAQISERPELGPLVGSARPGLRKLRAGRHVVFYRISGDAIVISRVLHERMDRDSHLS